MNQFDGPIPGQSLTGAPKSFPWERPPEMTDPEQVLVHYLDRLNTTESLESITDLLELDVTIVQLTEGITRVGVAEGLHTIDVALLVNPIIHEFIKSVADELGLEYEEGIEDKKGKKEREEFMKKERKYKMLQKLKAERKSGENDEVVSDPLDLESMDLETDMMPEEAEPMMEEAPKGLMARRS